MSGNRGIVNGIRREMVNGRPCDLDNHKASDCRQSGSGAHAPEPFFFDYPN